MKKNSSSKHIFLVRKAKLSDALQIHAMQKEGLKRKTWIYTGKNKVSKHSLKKMEDAFKANQKDNISLVAIDTSTQTVVGSITLRRKSSGGRLMHRAELGWGVHPDFQGRGIGTLMLKEALNLAKKIGYVRAEAEVACENTASLKLSKKLGFEIEGTLKKGMLTDDGRYIDTHILGKVL